MSIALSAIVVFLILAPGFVFRARYRRIEKVSVDSTPFGEAVFSGVFFSLLFHLLWLAATYRLGYVPKLSYVLQLLSESKEQSELFRKLEAQQAGVCAYFGTMFLASFLLAPAVRWVAERNQWHLPESKLFRVFGIHAPWHHLFKIRAEQLGADTLVATIVNYAGTGYVVRGLLNRFYLNDNGDLDRVVLDLADRRLLANDKTEETSDPEARFYPIDGDAFVVRYSEMITLNVQYLRIEFEQDVPEAEAVSGSG